MSLSSFLRIIQFYRQIIDTHHSDDVTFLMLFLMLFVNFQMFSQYFNL